MTTTSILASTPEKVKPLRIDPERGLCRTSKYLPLVDAKRLCQRLNNLSGILDPVVVNIRTSDGKARVQWQPLAPGSRLTDVSAFVATREKQAAEQSAVMSFYKTAGHLQYACVNEDGHGNPHLVDLGNHECSCEDFQHRCFPLSEKYGVPVPCHHLVELNRRLCAGEPLSVTVVTVVTVVTETRRDTSGAAREARQERVMQTIGRDF